jgi:hypothetical protein
MEMPNSRSGRSRRFAARWRAVAAVPLFAIALLAAAPGAAAQDAPLRVSVNGKFYRVSDNVVSGEDTAQPLDALTSRKASLAAQVLDREILYSNFAARLFSPTTRALVMSAMASGRLIEPWQRTLATSGARPSETKLASASENFKAWASRLAGDPKQLALAVARKVYSDGFAAYRENAAIYRSVMNQNETLSYDAAIRFLRNEMATRRLAVAFEIERYFNDASAVLAASPPPGPEESTKARQRIQTEVIDKVGTGVTSPADLERNYLRLARIAESEQPTLRSYLGTVRPAVVRFTFTGGKGGDAASGAPPGAAVTGFAGQNAVTVSVPMARPKNPPVNITGGVLPLPPGITAPVQGNRPPARPAPQGNSNAPNNANPATDHLGSAGGSPGAGDTATPDSADATLANNSSPASPAPGDPVNLKTYSSKPYHSADGMVFNPLNGMWENPGDPSDYRLPAVITCCDDTGLAFPDDALEAQQDYWWDGGATDPNCGRLYDCRTVIDTTGGTDNGSSPTDRDGEILQVLQYLDQLPPDQRGPAMSTFLDKLPPAYRKRVDQLQRRYNASRGGTPRAAALNYSATPYSGSSPGNNSTITGLGGGVASNYTQITQPAAQAIVTQYKSIPGGVTLEGGSADLSFIKSVAYQPEANAFILNNDLVYLNPVSGAEFLELYRALASDDRLGVSLGSTQAIVFGNLPPESVPATNLELADKFLADITFGNKLLTSGYVFAPGYPGAAPRSVPNIAVYFNIHDFHFSRSADGGLSRSGVRLDTTLVPLSSVAGSDGGHQPDFDRITKGNVPQEYVANLKHLQDNIAYYTRERIVRQAIAYGEAAAFIRALKLDGVKLDAEAAFASLPSSKDEALAPTAPASGDSCALAAEHWHSTESIGTRVAYEDHLARFPTCAFATLAKARIAALGPSKPAPAATDTAKTCAAGFAPDSDGDCVRRKSVRKPPAKRVTSRAAPETASTADHLPVLDCSNPSQIMACANRALTGH